MRKRLVVIPVVPLALLALALTTAATVHAQRTSRVRVLLPAYRNPVVIDTLVFLSDHKFKAGAVWKAAEKVFYDLKLPVDTRDSVGGVVGFVTYVKSSFLGRERMSKVLNCGQSITGPNADNFRINMALVALVTRVTDSTATLGVGFIGSGLDMRGPSTNPMPCASTGWVEGDFAERVKAILRAAP